MKLFQLHRLIGARKRGDLTWFPPYWLLGIRILDTGDNWRQVRIKLPLTFFTRNMGKSMFGGCQASLADPIPAIACAHVFPDYSVWTRNLSLDFQRTGLTDLELRFEFDPDIEAAIREDLRERNRSTPSFEFGFYDGDGNLCTQVHNTVAIRPKGYLKQKSAYR